MNVVDFTRLAERSLKLIVGKKLEIVSSIHTTKVDEVSVKY